MLASWLIALSGSFVTLPVPLAQAMSPAPTTIEPAWFEARCLSTRCADEEWQRELERVPLDGTVAHKPRLPGVKTRAPLRVSARARESVAAYSNNWRIGTRYGYQLLRDPQTRLNIELGAGYRLAALHDDGTSLPGPVFRGGIDLGRRLGERTQWTQRTRFEAGNGERFVKQTLGLDILLDAEWRVETDYVIRYDSRGASGSDTAEAWLGVRRRF